ncbi:MAG: TMEM175 family protein [Rudaea sp.]|nr:TMEM175 family protein [Rudaea sp.]
MKSTRLDPTDVLRIRRHQPTRLEGFIDASFAFVVTLLVISIGHTPSTVPEMLHALRGIPAFALCFFLVVRLWKAHRDWSRYYDLEDRTSISLSLALVFLVMVFVHPLRLLFALLFSWVSAGYLVDQPVGLQNVEELRWAFEVYGIGFAAIAGLFALLYRHALRRSGDIGLDARELLATRMHMAIWSSMAGLAALSTLSAAVLPFHANQPFVFTLPGLLYSLTGILAPQIRRHCTQRLALLPNAT